MLLLLCDSNSANLKMNRELETYDDFDDDAVNVKGTIPVLSNGHASSLSSSKLSHLIASNPNKLKVSNSDVNFLYLSF